MTLSKYIESCLHNGTSSYTTAVDCDGEQIKIRVSDHSCNDRNNTGRCLSFITNRTARRSGQWENVTEWVMGYDDEVEVWLDGNRDEVSDILADYCIVGYYKNGEYIKE